MPDLPYQVSGTVYDTDGTTTLSGVTIRLRNETSNETLSAATASDGSYVLNLANLPSGWAVGDSITVFVLYTSSEGSSTFTVTTGSGGKVVNITLSTVPASGTLRYFTVQQFYDFFNMKPTTTDSENGIDPKRMIRAGLGVELAIDQATNTKFDSNSETNVYIPGKGSNQTKYFLGKAPTISLTTLQTTQTAPGGTATWDTLTSGRENDYVLESDIGMVDIVDDNLLPPAEPAALRWTGTWGYSSVPQDIRLLAIVWTGVMLMGANVVKTRIADKSAISVDGFDWFNAWKSPIIESRRVVIPYNT